MKAIIPLAGLGTRLYPLTLTTPKPLIKVLNKPVLEWNLESLIKNNVKEVVLIISNNKNGDLIKSFVESNNFDITINYAFQEDPLGTAHAVKVAEKYFDGEERFLYLNGDDIYGPDNIAQVLAADQAIIAKEVEDPEKWGILQIDNNSNLKNFIEKPSSNIGNLASIHCMKLSTKIFPLYDSIQKSSRGEYELPSVIRLIAQTEEIKVLKSNDYWLPIGYPWHILEATEFLIKNIEDKKDGNIEENVTIKGKVVLPKSSTIKSGTYIEGNLIVGENCVIGPNAYIKKNVVLADNSQIGAFNELKNVVIGENTKIPHLSYLGDSIIGNNTNISANTITANLRHDNANIKTIVKNNLIDTGLRKLGAIIGDNVKTGIGTRIYPGRKIWPDKTTMPNEIVKADIK